jgi:hypothetical protein
MRSSNVAEQFSPLVYLTENAFTLSVTLGIVSAVLLGVSLVITALGRGKLDPAQRRKTYNQGASRGDTQTL